MGDCAVIMGGCAIKMGSGTEVMAFGPSVSNKCSEYMGMIDDVGRETCVCVSVWNYMFSKCVF